MALLYPSLYRNEPGGFEKDEDSLSVETTPGEPYFDWLAVAELLIKEPSELAKENLSIDIKRALISVEPTQITKKRNIWSSEELNEQELREVHNQRLWSKDEIRRLEAGYKEYKENNWPAISKIVGTRTARQCYSRIRRTMSDKVHPQKTSGNLPKAPTLKHNSTQEKAESSKAVEGSVKPNGKPLKWTEDEVNRLQAALKIYGDNWLAVTKYVRTRTKVQCQRKRARII